MSLACNVSSTWRTANVTYANVSSTWRHVPQVYVNISGTWRPVWSYYWNPLGWGACSATCGGGIQYRTVNCTRNDGTVWDARVCNALIGANPYPTSQACNTHACVTCYYNNVPAGNSTIWFIPEVENSPYPCGVFVNAKTSGTPTCALSPCSFANTQTQCGPYTRGALRSANARVQHYEVCY